MFKIGNIKIENDVVLAPMAGITDHSFRVICKEFGAGLVYTEFVSANGIIRENEKTLDMIKFKEYERPIGVQIFGDDPEILAKSASYIYEKFKPDIIDINYGCPVPKITKKGAGSAALKDMCRMKDITQSVVESVPKIPVTVKMRAGWDKDNIVSTKAGQLLESIGVKAITLHGRTTNQQFTGKANWNFIKDLKENVSIPVIGNGDVDNYADFIKMKNYTKCDAVMIGRGSLGRPWIFEKINNKQNDNEYPSKSLSDIIDVCLRHINLLIINKGEKVSLNLSKKHVSYYLKGFNNASKYRSEIMKCDNVLRVKSLLESINS